MKKKPVGIEVVDVANGRFIVRTYADGTTEQLRVVKLKRKKRYPARPARQWAFDKTKKKGL